MSHKVLITEIDELNHSNELKSVFAENEAPLEQIRQVQAQINYYKAIKAQIQCLYQHSTPQMPGRLSSFIIMLKGRLRPKRI